VEPEDPFIEDIERTRLPGRMTRDYLRDDQSSVFAILAVAALAVGLLVLLIWLFS
jgi:hypothetical protein